MSSTDRPVPDGTRSDVAVVLMHYGSEVSIRLDATSVRHVMEAIGAHATRGGWVTVTDEEGRSWSLLVTPGIPIWIED